MDTQKIIAKIVEDVTVDGTVNLDALNEIVNGLKDVVKTAKADAKAKAKEAKEKARADAGEAAKVYYNSLAIGDVFEYITSDGERHQAKKIETKSKTGATAACELVNPPATAKTTKRYPKFYQVIVPESFDVSVADEDVEVEIA